MAICMLKYILSFEKNGCKIIPYTNILQRREELELQQIANDFSAAKWARSIIAIAEGHHTVKDVKVNEMPIDDKFTAGEWTLMMLKKASNGRQSVLN